MAVARASGLGNRSPLGLSPLLHGERWRELDPASWSGQVHGMKTCIEQSCKPEVACSLAYHLSNLTSLHGLLLQPVGEQRSREATWNGAGLCLCSGNSNQAACPKGAAETVVEKK